ncbi:MAG: hypothetical protein ACTH58_04960 [Marinomonas foliarum]|uniref:hypothetical protein n=1 Tax=Marinomonas foliarum TaxID=491950 RepID=UPI003F98708E
MGCSPRQIDSILTASEKADMIALIMIESGGTMDEDIIEKIELEEHEREAKAHFGMK